MTAFPEWLPAMVSVNPWNIETFNILYEIFERDFKHTRPVYENRTIGVSSAMEDGKEKVFWHITHKDDKDTQQRLPDFARSARLPWVKSIIEHAQESEVLAWDYKESGNRVNTYVWLKDYDFLVILNKNKNGRRWLVTAYCIQYPSYRRKLERKYQQRI